MLLFAGLGYCLFVPPSWSDMEVYNVILHPFIVSAPMWCGKWSRKRRVVGRHWARKKQTYWKTATDSTWRLNPWPMTSSTWTTVSRCDSNHCVQWNTSNKDWIILVSSTFQKSIFFLFHDIARSAKLLSCTSPAYPQWCVMVWQVSFTPNGVDLKMLQPCSAPLRRHFLPAVKVEYSVSTRQSSYRIQIHRIQVKDGALY